MKTRNLKIHLLSDMCTYSGEGYNTTVDTDVVYDSYGIPYIPAKRLKGCIREACMELVDFGIIDEIDYMKLFGSEGNSQSAFYLSNAYPENYKGMVQELVNSEEQYTAQQVLELFAYTRCQTAVSLESGTAEKNMLRTMRVVKRGMVFEAELSWRDKDINEESKEYKAFEKAISVVKHIGYSRTRGLGFVNMCITCIDEAEKDESFNAARVLFEENEITDYNRIFYEIYLDSPMICKSPAGNQAVTQDYISGGKILGLLAGQLGSEQYRELLNGPELIVSNAYIKCGRKRTIPARKSWQKEKDTGFDNSNDLSVLDMICSQDVSDKQMTAADAKYVDDAGNVLSVFTEISYHHKRPDDKSVGRATGKDNSSFYQLESIQAGQCFEGYILADRKQTGKIVNAVKGMKNVRMGYGRSAEFGKVIFTLSRIIPEKTKEQEMHDAVITLVSDLIMYNEYGAPSTSINCLRQYLVDALSDGSDGPDDLTISNTFLEFETIGGYNTTWGRMKQTFSAIGKGSVFTIHSKNGFNIGKADAMFLGERVSEGYGEIKINEIPECAEYILHDAFKNGMANNDKPESEEEEKAAGIIAKLRKMKKRHLAEQEVRSLVNNIKLENDIFGIAVSKLIRIFKSVSDYNSLLEQVKNIKTKETREACDTIVKNIALNMLAGKIPMQKVELKKDEYDKAYRFIYQVYLTELKYHAKIQKQNTKGAGGNE